MSMNGDGNGKAAHVAAYKAILRSVIDQRPSGTRGRLATALGKNRSFISQITNPAYPVPIPTTHVDIILDICHFPPAEKSAFLEAYGRAHPKRPPAHRPATRVRNLLLEVPDLGSVTKNAEFDELLRDFLRRLGRIVAR